jgi:hypothetical protein
MVHLELSKFDCHEIFMTFLRLDASFAMVPHANSNFYYVDFEG